MSVHHFDILFHFFSVRDVNITTVFQALAATKIVREIFNISHYFSGYYSVRGVRKCLSLFLLVPEN